MNQYKNNKHSINIPDGAADIIFGQTLYIKKAIELFCDIYEQQNFREIITPALEYYDTFCFAGQPIAQEMMYKLSDISGRLLVLRPDSTTPVARVVSTKLSDDFVKVYYNQNVFRINAGYSGKKSEIIQSGVEIIGANGIKTDLHYIETALKILKSTGLNFKLEIGHVGVCIPLLFGGIEVIEQARQLAYIKDNKKANEILDYLQRLYNILDNAGYSEHIIIDLGIEHEIDYYTGLVIGGYVEGIGESVLSGGRYDNLIANFGRDLPAVGFAVNVNLIAAALEKAKRFTALDENLKIDEIVHYAAENYAAAACYVNKRQLAGINAELSCFDSIDKTKEYAAKMKIENVVYIQESEADL